MFRQGPLARALRWLDYLPTRTAWLVGLGFGILAGAALGGWVPRGLGVVGFLGLLGLGWAVAWGGEPIAWVEPNPALASTFEPNEPSVPVHGRRFLDLVSLPGGSFLMGSPKDEEGRFENEGPVHRVQVSSFSCSRYPVTRRLYAEISGSEPGWPEGQADDRPVNNVSWDDAIDFCNRLSELEGLAPCYLVASGQTTWDPAANGYRLLTEAEWEYACRAGSTTRYCFGDGEGLLAEHAWFGGNSGSRPHMVGRKQRNSWGLNDLHGNVWEWCWDRFGPYSEAEEVDPSGPDEGLGRVLRGGAFFFPARVLRSAYRDWEEPTNRGRFIGFRCALGPRRQP